MSNGREGLPAAEISAEQLQQMAADLRASITARELQEEKKLINKLYDRETLIGEAKKLEEKFGVAKETQAAFQEASQAGKLAPEDAKQFEQVSKIVREIEGMLMDINDKIAEIEGRRTNLSGEELKDRGEALLPQEKVRDRLHEEAKEEDEKRTKRKEFVRVQELIEAKEAELIPKIDALVAEIIKLGGSWQRAQEDLEQKQSNIDLGVREIRSLVKKTAQNLTGGKGADRMAFAIESLANGYLGEIIPGIERIRRDLWFYKTKEKDALAGLAVGVSRKMEAIEKDQGEYEGLKKHVQKLEEAAEKIAQEYGALLERAKEAEDQEVKIELNHKLRSVFHKKIEDTAVEVVNKRRRWMAPTKELASALTSDLNKGLAWAYGAALTAERRVKS